MSYPYKIRYYFGNLADSIMYFFELDFVTSKYYIHNFLELFYHYPRLVLYGIQNLIKYFNVIWNDRDWDFVYFFDLLKKKFECMEKYTRQYGCHENSEYDADNMKKCIELIDKLTKYDYYINHTFDTAEKERKTDKELLFHILTENIENWWE